jgi:hypothetical protein
MMTTLESPAAQTKEDRYSEVRPAERLLHDNVNHD